MRHETKRDHDCERERQDKRDTRQETRERDRRQETPDQDRREERQEKPDMTHETRDTRHETRYTRHATRDTRHETTRDQDRRVQLAWQPGDQSHPCVALHHHACDAQPACAIERRGIPW